MRVFFFPINCSYKIAYNCVNKILTKNTIQNVKQKQNRGNYTLLTYGVIVFPVHEFDVFKL